MPIYEYRCNKCGNVFEAIQSFSAEPLKSHADCGGAVERLISPPALQFKGSGWYITDYARSGSSSASGAKNGGESTKSENASSSASGSSPSSTSSTPSNDKK